jgi:hypothetical protein
VGFKTQSFDIIDWKYLKYCDVSIVKSRANNFDGRLIVVYGSLYDDTKMKFLEELNTIMGT